jgi:hypothetical protein
VKLKDKPTADALATWYALHVKRSQPAAVLDDDLWQASYAAGKALAMTASPDSPEPLAEWLAAFRGNEQLYDDAFYRFVRAQHALNRACAEGVTCEAQGQAHG